MRNLRGMWAWQAACERVFVQYCTSEAGRMWKCLEGYKGLGYAGKHVRCWYAAQHLWQGADGY